ncbi:MAG: ribonuclease HI family protein [Patescibacteria group bacterium]|nr:ribonuclease HI family protein [Patescibacteria group bacterium]
MPGQASATIYTDGGARGNPGPAGIGAVIKVGDKAHHFKQFIGHATNNQAEYRAVLLAFEEAKKMGLQELNFVLDSELVVRQLRREYRVKDQDLAKLFVKIWNLSQGFKKITYRHVPREQNREADRLVNEAIDGAV